MNNASSSCECGLRQRSLLALGVLLALWSCGSDGERPDIDRIAGGGPELPRAAATRGSAQVAGDWRHSGGDPGHSGFSRLGAIHAGNVASLQPAWQYTLERNPVDRDAWPVARATPLVVGGVVYLAHGSRVVALDGGSGELLWRHTARGVTFGSRGMAYWPGDERLEPRLLVAAADRLLVLSARNGRPVSAFGAGGQVVAAIPDGAVPLVAGTHVIVASTVGPGVRAWNLNSGQELWRYDAPDWAAGAGQVSAMSADLDRALLYVAFSARADINRPATAETVPPSSVVVLDIVNGQPVWRFDAVRRDVWRHGLVGAPLLYPVWRDAANAANAANAGGLALISGAGLVYLLDRVSGDPLLSVLDRPVPRHPPGALELAPTQPFPQGEPVHSQRLARADLIVDASQTNEFHAAACAAMIRDAALAESVGPFAPLVLDPAPDPDPDADPDPDPDADADPDRRGAVVRFPDGGRFATQGGVALDPATGYLFVNVSHIGAVSMEAATQISSDAAEDASGDSRFPDADSRAPDWAPFSTQPQTPTAQGAWPCQPPPWGELVAVNTADGGIAWRVPLGTTEGLGEDLHVTGRPSRGGPLATAGGLVFIAATDDRSLRAFASNNGEELWRAPLPMNAFSTPFTYRAADGRQYVAVIAGGGTILDTPVWSPAAIPQLLAFAVRDP